MGKAYKARAAEGYYDQFLEILYYVYIYIFPMSTHWLESQRNHNRFSSFHHENTPI